MPKILSNSALLPTQPGEGAVTRSGYEAFRQGFYQIDNIMLDLFGAEIGPYGIAVYNALAMHAGTPDQYGRRKCWPSYQRIQDKTGMSRNGVIGAVAKLEKAGLVEVVRGRSAEKGKANVSNIYFLLPIKSCQMVPSDSSSSKPPAETSASLNPSLDNRPILEKTRKEAAIETVTAPNPSACEGLANQPANPQEALQVSGLVPEKHYPCTLEVPEQDSENKTQFNKTQERMAKTEETITVRADDKHTPSQEDTQKQGQEQRQLSVLPTRLNSQKPEKETNNQPSLPSSPPNIPASFEARQVQEFARQKFGGKAGQGVTSQWLANRIQQYGQKAVRAAITIAEERAKPTACFISSVLERMTPDELTGFSQDGQRLRIAPLNPIAGANSGAGSNSSGLATAAAYQSAKGSTLPPPNYPFSDFTPGFDDNPAAIERRIQNLRVRDALSPTQAEEYALRLEWARKISASTGNQSQLQKNLVAERSVSQL